MEPQQRSREKLDVPLVAPLERKLASLTRQRPTIGPAPRSAVLDKLASFLPQMAHENDRLQEEMASRPAADFDIEQVNEEGEEPYIEMDLACGLFELRDEAALMAAQRAMDGQGGLTLAESSSDEDSDSDDDDDSDSDEVSETSGAELPGSSSSSADEDLLDSRGSGLHEVGTSDTIRDGMDCEVEGGNVGCDGGSKSADSNGACTGLVGAIGVAEAVDSGDGSGRGGRRKVAMRRSKLIQELP